MKETFRLSSNLYTEAINNFYSWCPTEGKPHVVHPLDMPQSLPLSVFPTDHLTVLSECVRLINTTAEINLHSLKGKIKEQNWNDGWLAVKLEKE